MTEFSLDGRSQDFTFNVMVTAMRGRPRNEPIRDYPNRLKEWREARGLTQAALGRLTGHKPQSVARHETGENQVTLDQMESYARALKIKPEELLNDAARVNPRLREVLELLDVLPPEEQNRAIKMVRAFAEPREAYAAPPPAPQRRRHTR